MLRGENMQINLKIELEKSSVAVVVKTFMKEVEFKEDVTEEYKKGFYDFGNAIIHALEINEEER